MASYLTDNAISVEERKYRKTHPWKAIDWGRPNEFPLESNGVIDGMTGQYQVHVDDEDDSWVCDAHDMTEAESIAAEHNSALLARKTQPPANGQETA